MENRNIPCRSCGNTGRAVRKLATAAPIQIEQRIRAHRLDQ